MYVFSDLYMTLRFDYWQWEAIATSGIFSRADLKEANIILGQAQSHDSDINGGRGSNTSAHGLDPPNHSL
jgi:hypothetical protein